jgi:hypothetical protein
LIGAAVILVGLLVAGGLFVLNTEERVSATRPTPAVPDIIEGAEISPDPEPYIPDPSEFELTAKILEKQCFGDAGCNITFRTDVAYNGPPLDPDVTYEVVYEIRGDEAGTQTNTLTVTGDQSEVDGEEICLPRQVGSSPS